MQVQDLSEKESLASAATGGTAAGMGAGLDGVAGAAAASLTEGMVVRLATLAERSATALDTVMSPEVLALLEQLRESAPALTRLLKAVDQAAAAAEADARPVGLLALGRALKEPEMQWTLKFLLGLARQLPAAVKE
ncbi:MAG TPA: DUF1641 domain-containing protein [Symbiobacteriaceae bacterium]|jgi:hypothetical protein|nr:DUF1641 domain-containing protein [Symbiobacteriaceae bacterium]